MGEYAVKLPDVGEGVAEAEIVEWHVAVGDTIEEDEVLVDVMSDKATIELPSPVSGIVRWVGGEVGDVLAVGSAIVVIDLADDGAAPAPAVAPPAPQPAAPAPPDPSTSVPPPPPGA
ncbi:MAG: 2-oxo acid dehydrogenase subunit E2, partial [Ilumatobacter sp.]|nr:2-oxo acid dehydrogenase subunit E2 [Ilumatobacter sp.]